MKTSILRKSLVSLSAVALAGVLLSAGVSAYSANGEISSSVVSQSEAAASSKISVSKLTIKLSKSSYTYDGKKKKPTVTVKYGSKTLKKNTDYTVSYSKNKSAGVATVSIKGKGKYSGTVKKTFIINPKKVSVTNVSYDRKAAPTITWQESKTADGYQLYMTEKGGAEKLMSTITKGSQTSFTYSVSLKPNTEYSFRIRPFAKSGSKYYYGSYSALVSKIAPNTNIPDYITIQGKQYSTKLTTLDLKDMKLYDGDIAQLKYMVNLTRLDISQNNITDISALESLFDIEQLDISSNKISSISAVSKMTKLKKLNASNNSISSVVALKGLKNITELNINENSASDLSTVWSLTSLKILAANTNGISDISGIKALTKLINLDLSNNIISDISSVKPLTLIYNLNLSGNKITSIDALSGFKALQTLDLSENNISNISPLSGAAVLKEAKLNDNNIEDISPLYKLQKIEKLYIRGDYNFISDSQVETLKRYRDNLVTVYY